MGADESWFAQDGLVEQNVGTKLRNGERIGAMGMRVIVLILGFLLVGCDGGASASPSVRNRLEASVASGATSFDFAADQGFTWERMFVFGPYTDQATVEKSLGFKWPDYRRTKIELSDSVCLVVFVRGGKVVYWYEQPRSIDLDQLEGGVGYSRSEAQFSIERDGSRAMLKRSVPSTGPTSRP